MSAYTIKDLENLSGIKAHTIRIWEQRYRFLKPRRTDTNIRYYCNDELKTILNIALLNKYGFKISHIDRMDPGEINEKILSLNDPKAIQERMVNELVREMAELDMDTFERIIGKFSAAKGVERTINQLICPFLEKTGLLWQTGHINPAQEHLVTNIIRQKLMVAIEAGGSRLKSDKTFLLFLPEGEHHELGLLYTYYLLKSRGVKVIYLGADVPLKDAAYVVEHKRPDIAFIHLTTNAQPFNFDALVHSIQQTMSSITTVIAGQVTNDYHRKLPAYIQLKKSLPEVVGFLNSV